MKRIQLQLYLFSVVRSNPESLQVIQVANMLNAQSVNHDDGTRIQALALAEAGIATKVVTALTKISCQTINRLQKQACERGYDPSASKKLLLSYISDKPRSGRPKVVTLEVESAILAAVRKDCYGCEKTLYMLAAEQGLSSGTILNGTL